MTYNQTHAKSRNLAQPPRLNNFLNEFFNTAVGDVMQKAKTRHFTNPATNVVTFEDRFVIELALPGFTKDDIFIEVEKDVLTIKNKDESQEEGVNYRLREFNYRGFSKTFKLPETVDTDSIEASFNLGILRIVLSKKKESIPQPPRSIQIK